MTKPQNPLVVPAQFDGNKTNGWHGTVPAAPGEDELVAAVTGLFAFGENFHDARVNLAKVIWAALPEAVRVQVDGVRLITVTRRSFSAEDLAFSD